MTKTINSLLVVALAAAAFTFTSCGEDEESLPPIDGYNNSNEVASENLLAHWTFDGTTAERISNTTATEEFGNVDFTAGQVGQALSLDEGALVYPPISNINTENALNNFTVSLWVNVENTKGAGGGFTSLFGLVPTNVTDIWGDIMANVETGWYTPASDTLALKNYLKTHTANGDLAHDNLATVNGNQGAYFMGAKKWSHYVMRWDAANSMYHIFADGEDVGAYTDRGDVGIMIMDTPVQAVFGSLASSDIGFSGAPAQQEWNPWATAMIDDVRIYNTVLSEAEINALYNLGTAGR